jgi:hypothetical protein
MVFFNNFKDEDHESDEDDAFHPEEDSEDLSSSSSASEAEEELPKEGNNKPVRSTCNHCFTFKILVPA